MVESLAKSFRIHSDSKRPRIMERDSFLQLIDSISSFDTETFLRGIVHTALLSPDPLAVRNRFMVKGLTHCKDLQDSFIPQHEFVIIELQDSDTLARAERSESHPIFIVLERTASSSRQSLPVDSSTLLAGLARTLSEIATNLTASSSLLSNSLNPSALSPYQAVATEEFELTESSQSSHLPSPAPLSHQARTRRLRIPDLLSLAVSRASHTSSRSSEVFRADDRFIGAQNFELYAQSNHNMRQLRPSQLSLFDLAVLANCVHNSDPNYSKFNHQCFWFSSIICDVVAKEYDCSTVSSDANSTDDISVPRNNYLPDFEGRWMTFLISNVEKRELEDMASKFRKYRQEKEDEVRFLFLFLTAAC